MRWYCVLCLAASDLKKSTLFLLRAIVTFTPCSRNARSEGGGRKSRMTLASMGSSVYLIFVLINSLAFPPVTGAEDTNHASAIGKADGQNAAFDLAETEMALLALTVSEVFRDDTMRVGESVLSQRERYPMLKPIFSIFVGIPFKLYLFHWASLTQDSGLRHTNIWRMIWLTLLRVHSKRLAASSSYRRKPVSRRARLDSPVSSTGQACHARNDEPEQRMLPRGLLSMPRWPTGEKDLAALLVKVPTPSVSAQGGEGVGW